MARGFLSRGVRIVAAGVVLRHSSPKCQVGSCPHLSLGPPPQLMLSVSRGLSWGPAKDVPILQSRIRDLFERDFSLVMVMQVMLVRRVHPCKRRPLRMWELNPDGPRAIQHFLGITLEEMYKSFFGPQIECPDTIEDVDPSCNCPAAQVSNPMSNLLSFYLSWHHSNESLFDQD